jgi:pyruvate-formate lyase-activating enzyme
MLSFSRSFKCAWCMNEEISTRETLKSEVVACVRLVREK